MTIETKKTSKWILRLSASDPLSHRDSKSSTMSENNNAVWRLPLYELMWPMVSYEIWIWSFGSDLNHFIPKNDQPPRSVVLVGCMDHDEALTCLSLQVCFDSITCEAMESFKKDEQLAGFRRSLFSWDVLRVLKTFPWINFWKLASKSSLNIFKRLH